MTVSADTLKLGVIAEVTPGATPANPAFSLIVPVSESFEYEPETQPSASINSNRQVTSVLRMGGKSSGAINLEMQDQAVIETLLEALTGGTWTANVLKCGTTKRTFSVEKSFDNAGTRYYQRYTHAVIDQFTLTAKADSVVTASFSFLAKKPTVADTEITGATYVAYSDRQVMAAPTVMDISIGGVTAYVVDEVTLSLNNNFRAISALGTEGPVDFNFGRLGVTLTFGLYMVDNVQLQAMLNDTEQTVVFTVKDASNNGYTFTLPDVRLTKTKVTGDGTNTDVIVTCAGTVKYDTGISSTLSITRTA